MAKRKSMTKSGVIIELANRTELPKKTVLSVFDNLLEMLLNDINPKSKTAPGVFTIPGIARIKGVKKPAKKARKGTNPFTGEEMMFKAKPASIGVKIFAVKTLKDSVN